MIILDTNVLSELMRPDPARAVQVWFRQVEDELICTTVVSRAEILAGISVLPDGRRRRELEASAAFVFGRAFGGPILPFDDPAAVRYAAIVAERQRIGRPIKPLDAMIAAIVRLNDAALATRDIGDFEGCGLALINPWSIEP